MFCALLGSLAGNVALTLGARGGVHLGGGILPRIADDLRRSDFRARFEAKPPVEDYLRPIPTSLIVHPGPALVGAAVRLAQTPAAMETLEHV
jgi:glucokinase